jgi:hypothetical protein
MALSNNTINTLNTEYYDDFYEVANTTTGELLGTQKDFHRVLFRPKYGVQSRELTQLQTILQKQLERLGTTQFRDGDRVVGGQLTLDTAAKSGRVETGVLANFFNRDTNLGKYVFDTSANTTIKAHVTQYTSADDNASGTTDIPATSNNYLIFKYSTVGTFNDGGVVQDRESAAITATFATSVGASDEVFTAASTISIDEGVCFVSGLFVRISPQTIVLDPLSDTPSYRIGFTVAEDFIDDEDDATLLDDANQGAPGAHRLSIRLTLDKHLLTTPATANFIELGQVIDGEMQAVTSIGTARFLTQGELNQTLARRTYDESGDYIVKTFAPVIEGKTTANSTNSAETDTFVLSVGQGKAYVRGSEAEIVKPIRKVVKKGRETANVEGRVLATTVGNYALVSRVAAGQNVANYFANTTSVDIHCVPVSNIVSTTTAAYNLSKVGTTKVRNVEHYSTPSQLAIGALGVNYANNAVYKLFFYDTSFEAPTGNVTNTSTSTATSTRLTISAAQRTTTAYGLPATINTAIDGASIVLYGADSPVTGTFTVNTSIANTTASYITLNEFLPTLPNANTQFRLLFQPRDIDAFALSNTSATGVTAPYSSGFAFQADVAPAGRVGGTTTGNVTIYNTNDNSLLYQLPEPFVKANSLTTSTATFSSWVQSSANNGAMSSSNNATLGVNFSTSGGGGAFGFPTGALTAATASEYFTIFDTTDDTLGRGRTVPFADVANVGATSRCISTPSVTGGVLSFKYHHGAVVTQTRTFIAVGKSLVTGHPARTKTYYVGNTAGACANTTGALSNGQVEFHTLNSTAGFAYSLKTPDVTNIRAVLYHAGNGTFTNTEMSTATNVTSYFTLDDGQRDNTYEYGRLVVKTGASTVISPTGRLLVIFDWFKHEGRGYAAVDSYLSADNVAKGMTYDDIPTYVSPKFSLAVNLRDTLDFRPTLSNKEYANGDTLMVFASSNTDANTSYTDINGEPYLIPVSDDIWTGDYAYYLSRIDRVSLFPDGTVEVKEGLPEVDPTIPTVEPGALLLYELRVPAYTLVDDVGKPSDVSLKAFEHKRFTMKDVSKVENRIKHLEYYTALSNLEQQARDTSILDSDNLERFKNGIVVDSFLGTTVADVGKSDFAASIDPKKHTLWPAFESTNFQFVADTAAAGSTGMTLVGDMAVPSYDTTSTFITQSLATHAISVNPFNVGTFFGEIELSPAVDIWKSTSSAPAQVVDMGGPTQVWIDANIPSRTVWGEWETTWAGTSETSQSSTPGASGSSRTIDRTRNHETEKWIRDDTWQDITSTSTTTTSTTASSTRTGTQYNYTSVGSTETIGNFIVDTSIIHNMRARDIVFSARGLLPGSAMYPYFDGKTVADYVQSANVLKLAPVATTTLPTFYVGQTLFVVKALTGTVVCTTGSTTLTGTSTEFDFEATEKQLLRITSGVTTFDRFLSSTASNTSATLVDTAPNSLSGATVSTLTPMTVAGVTSRVTSANTAQTEVTVKLVRAVRDADNDEVHPYDIVAGSLRPEKNVKDATIASVGATLVVSATGRNTTAATMTVNTAVITSGIVRSYASDQLRLDIDITDSKVPIGAVIHLVGGPGGGQSTTVLSYDAATQTATVDSQVLTNITAGSTIYSVGALAADDYLASSAVTAGGAGTVAGVLHMQDSQFATGTRSFRLTDSETDVVAEATSSADTNYTSSGLAVVDQFVSATTRTVGVNTQGTAGSKSSTEVTTSSVEVTGRVVTTGGWYDPLAQTIMVNGSAYPQGVFVSSVDLCFGAKPADDIPVFVELRPVVNGYPSSRNILPCAAGSGQAVASHRMADVTTTTTPDFGPDALGGVVNTSTRFEFPALVHLKGGTEYAIVIHSNSDEYTVYTAELGGTLVGTDQKVSKQPYAGSFFKSQNASTWTESPFEDLMFRVNRAKWALNAGANTGSLVMRAVQPTTNTAIDRLVFYPHEVVFPNTSSTAYTLSLKPEEANNTGTLNTGAVAVTYTTFPQESYALNTRSLIQGYATVNSAGSFVTGVYPAFCEAPSGTQRSAGTTANTIDAVITLTTTSTDVAPFVDLKKINVIGIKHLINNLGLTANQFSTVNPSKGYPPHTKTGTVTTSSTSNVVTGVGTYFTGTDPHGLTANGSADTLVVGESVVIDGNMAMVVSSITSNVQFVAESVAPETRSGKTYGIYDHIALTVSNSASGNGATGYAVVNATSTTDMTGTIDSVVLSANGSGYTGTPTVTLATYALTGTVSNSATTTALVGSGTFFEVDLKVGNVILINGTVEATVNSITSNTALTVTSALSAAVAANTYTLSGNTGSILYHGEDYQSGGPALTRYFTKPVNLATGFDACDLTVYFDAIRPNGSNIHVYYKILPGTSDNARLDDQSWRLMEQKTSDARISDTQYHAFEYHTTSGCAADSSTDTTDKFRMFAVKVVMSTKDTTYVPTIKNFRAIALDA